jgi:trehalose-6-phosphate synthase
LTLQGEYKYKVSEGGLATALAGLKKTMSFIWIGWTGILFQSELIPGMVIPDADQEIVTEKLRREYSALPIYLDEDTAEKHYNGFSNSILWYTLSRRFDIGLCFITILAKSTLTK